MSPHRLPVAGKLLALIAADSTAPILALSGGVLAPVVAFLTGFHLVLLYAVGLAQAGDVWTGAARAGMTDPPTYDKRKLWRGIRKKGYRIGAMLLIGAAVDLAARSMGGFFDAGMLESAGRSGITTMLGLAALFTAEANSALANYAATVPHLKLGTVRAGVRAADVLAGQAAGALSDDGTVHARRHQDVLLRELQEAGAAPLVPGEGLVPLDAEVVAPVVRGEIRP
jgi:hypothetical protein